MLWVRSCLHGTIPPPLDICVCHTQALGTLNLGANLAIWHAEMSPNGVDMSMTRIPHHQGDGLLLQDKKIDEELSVVQLPGARAWQSAAPACHLTFSGVGFVLSSSSQKCAVCHWEIASSLHPDCNMHSKVSKPIDAE